MKFSALVLALVLGLAQGSLLRGPKFATSAQDGKAARPPNYRSAWDDCGGVGASATERMRTIASKIKGWAKPLPFVRHAAQDCGSVAASGTKPGPGAAVVYPGPEIPATIRDGLSTAAKTLAKYPAAKSSLLQGAPKFATSAQDGKAARPPNYRSAWDDCGGVGASATERMRTIASKIKGWAKPLPFVRHAAQDCGSVAASGTKPGPGAAVVYPGPEIPATIRDGLSTAAKTLAKYPAAKSSLLQGAPKFATSAQDGKAARPPNYRSAWDDCGGVGASATERMRTIASKIKGWAKPLPFVRHAAQDCGSVAASGTKPGPGAAVVYPGPEIPATIRDGLSTAAKTLAKYPAAKK